IEVAERIFVESNDVENNVNVTSDSKLLYAEVVKDIPFWVDCEVKKRKRVVKAIDIDFDTLFKLLNDVIPKNPKVLSQIMVDDDGNGFVDLVIPQVDKERDAITSIDYEVSRLGLGKSTSESNMEMPRDSMDVVLKRLEKYKSQNSQLKAEKKSI
ncbi:hypothetical protein KI387_016288, partial [Taxus chinensis]